MCERKNTITKAYSEPSQTSKMEFLKNSYRLSTVYYLRKSSILDVRLGSEYVSELYSVVKKNIKQQLWSKNKITKVKNITIFTNWSLSEVKSCVPTKARLTLSLKTPLKQKNNLYVISTVIGNASEKWKPFIFCDALQGRGKKSLTSFWGLYCWLY